MRAHLAGEDDTLVTVAPALERYGDFGAFLGAPLAHDAAWRRLRQAESTGRPVGDATWITSLEARTGRTLAPQKREPKPKQADEPTSRV